MHPTFLAAAASAMPQTPLQRLNSAGNASGYQIGQAPDVGLINIISTVINAALALTGVIVLAYIIYGGYVWMTAGGDSDKVTKAKETITRSIIGLAIVLLSYAIANFIVPAIYCASNPLATGCLYEGLLAPSL